jgi:hypothetical protein
MHLILTPEVLVFNEDNWITYFRGSLLKELLCVGWEPHVIISSTQLVSLKFGIQRITQVIEEVSCPVTRCL